MQISDDEEDFSEFEPTTNRLEQHLHRSRTSLLSPIVSQPLSARNATNPSQGVVVQNSNDMIKGNNTCGGDKVGVSLIRKRSKEVADDLSVASQNDASPLPSMRRELFPSKTVVGQDNLSQQGSNVAPILSVDGHGLVLNHHQMLKTQTKSQSPLVVPQLCLSGISGSQVPDDSDQTRYKDSSNSFCLQQQQETLGQAGGDAQVSEGRSA